MTDPTHDAERFPCLDCGAAPNAPCRPLAGDDHEGTAQWEAAHPGERLVHWERQRLLIPPPQRSVTAEPPPPPVISQMRVDRALVAFLRDNIDAITQDEAAGQLARDIHRLRQRIEAAIDNRDPDVYYGPCQADAVETTEADGVLLEVDGELVEMDGVVTTTLLPGVKCGADLIGELGAHFVQCRECRTVWRTDELHGWLTEKLREAWVRPSVIVAALRARGETITIEKLKNWIARDKAEHDAGRTRRVPYPPILPVGVEPRLDGDGRPVMTPLLDDAGEPKRDEAGRPILIEATRPVYRLGDALARIEALAAIEKARREQEQAG